MMKAKNTDFTAKNEI